MADLKINILAQDKSKQAFDKLQKNVNQSKTSLLNLKNVLLAVASSVVIRQIFSLTNEFQNLQNRLKLVTNSTFELNKVQEELFQISRRTRGGFSETVELYQKLALQSQNLGLKNTQLLQITENVNKVIGIAGVNSIQASSGILQLSQAFASGRLQGDEFRSISENIPPLLDIFAKELGVTRGELKKLGAEGKITSDIIATALLKETDNINKKFQQITPTIGQATTRLGNSFLNLVGKFNEVTGSADMVSKSILGVSDAIDKLAVKSEQPKLLQALTFAFSGIFIKESEIAKKLGVKLEESNHHMFRMANNSSRVKENVKEIIKFTSTSNHHMFEMANSIGLSEKTFRSMNQESLKGLEEKVKNVSSIFKESLNGSITKLSEGFARAWVYGGKLSDTLRSMAQQFMFNILSSLIEIVARKGVELAIEKMITREKQKQAMLSTSNALSGLGSLVGFFGGRASGGSVQKGQPYVVGENGAELFVPNQTGQITQSARGTGGGQTTVNFNINTVDASGFEELLIRSRGTITQLINSAVNERGAKSII